MHLEDYHGERGDEDDARRLDQVDDFAVDDGSLPDLASMAMTGMIGSDIAQPHCWTTIGLQTDNGSFFSSLDSGADSRDYLDWDQVPIVFQYPAQYLSTGSGSPGSTCSEAITPTWSNAVTMADHRYDDKSDCQKLPSVGSAFSFSRTFCNTIYPEYGGAEDPQADYQDYQDCQEDVVSLLMSIQNDVAAQDYSGSSIADEFDLSLIRGDPTSLLNVVDSSSSATCLEIGDDQRDSFQNFNPPYYAIGHLVSSQQQQQQQSSSMISFAGEAVGTTESFDNQVILPRNEGLLLGNRRIAGSKVVENDKNDKTYGKYAVLLIVSVCLRKTNRFCRILIYAFLFTSYQMYEKIVYFFYILFILIEEKSTNFVIHLII